MSGSSHSFGAALALTAAPLSCREERLQSSGGFLLGPEELADLFVAHRMYPAILSVSPDTGAARLLGEWLRSSRGSFDESELPWVPIARAGPLLVLGHTDVAISPPPLPWGTFQPVCLTRDDYERQLSWAATVLRGETGRRSRSRSDRNAGVGRFPEVLVLPTNRDNAFRFLQEYYLVDPDEADRPDAQANPRPANQEPAVWFLLNEGALAVPSSLRFCEKSQQCLPAPLRRRIQVIHEAGMHLWCTSSVLPQGELEDRLYAELGEGWTIHWVLGTAQNPEDESTKPETGPEQPLRILLPRDNEGRRLRAGELAEAEERLVSLSAKDWSRFDPRFRGSAEPEDLWKWALYRCLQDGATDLHIEPGPNTTRVRQRIDGLLECILEVPSAVGEAMVYSLMTQVGLGSDKYRPCDGSFQVQAIGTEGAPEAAARVRASAYPVRGVTQKLALRLLPRQGAVPTLEALLPSGAARYVTRAISRTEGLVLVCGPTGSGKTTTIFAALSKLNRSDLNVTTLENPVEILLDGLNQAEVNPRRDVTWSSLNRAFLRQDPDVGLIGEIRDEDTARTILRAALTGHLVFGSLHTKSCPTSVIRMCDLGVQPDLLAESLLLVVCQRLVRRLCPKCRRETRLLDEQRSLYSRHGLPVPESLFHAPHGPGDCDHCRGRGYRGRLAAVEVLPNVPRVRQLIEERAVSQRYADWMKERGLHTVFENALELAASGETSLAEALTLQDAWSGDDWLHLS